MEEEEGTWGGRDGTRWYYTLAAEVDPMALDPNSLPDLLVSTPSPEEERQATEASLQVPPDISGKGQRKESASAAGLPDLHDCLSCGAPLLAPVSRQTGICQRCVRAQQPA
jgi:hypothetical protein